MSAENDTNRLLRSNAAAVVLVTIPLVIIAVMAVRTIVTDKAASQARAGEAALQVARSYAVQLQTKIASIVSERFDRLQVSLSAVDDYVSYLRRIVHERTPPFVALYEREKRVFPPEDDAALLFQERQFLAQVGPALTRALENVSEKEGAGVWARFLDEPHLFTCRDVGANRILCIASTPDELQHSVSAVFSSTNSDFRQPIELIDPWGQRQWPANKRDVVTERAASLDLAGVFAGWQIRVGIDAAAGSIAPLITAIVVPVMMGWGLALIALFRYQAETDRQHRMRAESAARLSHDLRTPIANLALYVDLITRHDKTNPAVMRCCSALEEEIGRLAIIADSTLRHSRGIPQQAANGPLVGADQVIRGLLSRYEPLMARSDCTLAFDAGAPAVLIDDRTGLERILVNLIDNARSHAGGANVEVSTRPSADGLVLTIVDDGRRSTTRPCERGDGHGLGLEVVKELAQSRGGTFKAFIESAGARFEVALPCAGPRAS